MEIGLFEGNGLEWIRFDELAWDECDTLFVVIEVVLLTGCQMHLILHCLLHELYFHYWLSHRLFRLWIAKDTVLALCWLMNRSCRRSMNWKSSLRRLIGVELLYFLWVHKVENWTISLVLPSLGRSYCPAFQGTVLSKISFIETFPSSFLFWSILCFECAQLRRCCWA